MASTSRSGLPVVATDRIKKELREMQTDPKPDIYVSADEQDIRTQHALIIGPKKTPYEGGFFYFILQCPNDYPSQPPKVRLMTTGNHKVRFNPNLYADGTVCVSILNTWEGNPWSPALTMSTLLLSIQTLMNEEPYYNEPGYEKGKLGDEKNVNGYNDFVQHETIRVAVCGMLENTNVDTCRMPQELKSIMENRFSKDYDRYQEMVKQKIHLDGSCMKDHFDGSSGIFNFSELSHKLKTIRDKY